jgi:predicted NAD-dependent protein-ADP-ribosyltransferase YbiA (DUF1768 family)
VKGNSKKNTADAGYTAEAAYAAGYAAQMEQHAALKAVLLGTGSAKIEFASPSDSDLGIGEDGEGKNLLGKALVEVRTKLRV